MEIDDPAGARWRVTRRRLLWRPRRRRPDAETGDPTSGVDVDEWLVGLLIIVGIVLLAILLPWLVLGLEAVLVVLTLPLVVVLRAARIARWPIEAWCDGRLAHAEAVRGWAASRERMGEWVELIRRGESFGAPPDA